MSLKNLKYLFLKIYSGDTMNIRDEIRAQCEWDFYHSPCGNCEFGLNDNCQHYYGKCPNEDK